jgi:nitroreductase
MTVIEAITKRKSCRFFDDTKVISIGRLMLFMSLCNEAPYASGGPRRIMQLADLKYHRNEFKKACCNQKLIDTCQAAIIFSTQDLETKLRSGTSKAIFDCAAAAMCVDLAAVSVGLSTCWIGNFHTNLIQEMLLSDSVPLIILVLGYSK